MRRRDVMHVIALAVRSQPAMEVGPIPRSNPFGAIFRTPLALRADVLRCIGIDEADRLYNARIVRWNGFLVALLVAGSFHLLGLPIGLFLLSKHNRFVANGLDRGGLLLVFLIGHHPE